MHAFGLVYQVWIRHARLLTARAALVERQAGAEAYCLERWQRAGACHPLRNPTLQAMAAASAMTMIDFASQPL
jgi:hypothetical protein